MSLAGHVENGVVVFDAGATLPEGTKVTIAPISNDQSGSASNSGDWTVAFHAAQALENYDFDAWRKQRDYDRDHARDYLP